MFTIRIYRSRRKAEIAIAQMGPQFCGSVVYRSWWFFGRLRVFTRQWDRVTDVPLDQLRSEAKILRVGSVLGAR